MYLQRLRVLLAELLGVDDGPDLTWYIGLGMALLGGLGINMGANLMKLGHVRQQRQKQGTVVWAAGMTLFVCGNLSNFTAASFTPATTITAVSSVQLISNVVFASLVLGERLTWPVAMGTVVITLGDVLLVGSGTHHSHSYNALELQRLFRGFAYDVYVACMAAVSIAAYALYMRLWEQVDRVGPHASAPWHVVKPIPVLYAIHSAAVGTQAIIMAKCLALLCKQAVTGPHRWQEVRTWFTYTLALALVAIGTFWVRSLNKGLRMFPALIIVPIMQMFWILFGVLAGGLFFQELDDFSRVQAVGFASGLTLLCAGVWCISPGQHSHDASKGGGDGPEAVSELHQRLLQESDEGDVDERRPAAAPGIILFDEPPLTCHPRLLASRLSLHWEPEAGAVGEERGDSYEGETSLLSLPAYAGAMFFPMSSSPPREAWTRPRTRSLDVGQSVEADGSHLGLLPPLPRRPDRTTTM